MQEVAERWDGVNHFIKQQLREATDGQKVSMPGRRCQNSEGHGQEEHRKAGDNAKVEGSSRWKSMGGVRYDLGHRLRRPERRSQHHADACPRGPRSPRRPRREAARSAIVATGPKRSGRRYPPGFRVPRMRPCSGGGAAHGPGRYDLFRAATQSACSLVLARLSRICQSDR